MADPPRRHGPYFQWSRALRGKTITRRVNEDQARLNRDWIANRKRMDATIGQMQKISGDAAEIMHCDQGDDQPGSGRATR